MGLHLRGYCARALIAATALSAGAEIVRADALTTAINAASNGLVSQQSGGAWTGPGAGGYNGTIISGLVNSYYGTGNSPYRTAAETGATTMINSVNNDPNTPGVFLGDEMYALTRVAGMQSNPASNSWETAANHFFSSTVNPYGGNSGYISSLVTSYGAEKSEPTIYLAYYTLAAYAVDARNNNTTSYGPVYRQQLINTLGKVADTAGTGQTLTYQSYPTGALGAAVWALAQTGTGLDNTLISGPTSGENYFGGHHLSDLPAMLNARYDTVSHTFFAELTDNSIVGYTEDTAFGILGLDAVDSVNHVTTYAAHVAAARMALTGAVDTGTGDTYDNALSPGYATDVFAGRTLQALQTAPAPEPATAGMALLGTAGLLLRRSRKKA